MYTKVQIDTLIEETRIKENMNSPRQVLEKYPELNAIYDIICNMDAQTTKVTEEVTEPSQDL